MNISNENRLLLYCAQTEISRDKLNEVKDILKLPLNWDEVLKSALWHRIDPLLYYNLKDIKESHLIPREIMEQLKKAYYGNLVRNTYLYAELKTVLDSFREEGIEVIVLKGAVLAGTVYDNIGLRPMNDIDLLVKEEALDRAEELMTELGYISYEGWESKDWFRRNHRHLAPFINQDNGIKVEIHRDIVSPGNPFNVDIRKLWGNAQCILIEGVDTLTLSHEDLIVQLCLHTFYLQPSRRRIRDLIDISQVVRFYGEHINWDLIIREALIGKFAFFIYYALYLTREFLDVEIKKEILDALKKGSNMRPFEEGLLMLIAKKHILLRDVYQASSSIFPRWFLDKVCKELIRESHPFNKIVSVLKIIFLRFIRGRKKI